MLAVRRSVRDTSPDTVPDLRLAPNLGDGRVVEQVEEPEPFRYRSLGELVELGSEFAVNEVMGFKFSGQFAALFWRLTYLYKLESPQSRARIAADWLLDLFYDPTVTQIRR